MSTRRTGREHTQRDRGRNPRPKMEHQVETHILSSSNLRVKVGERCKLQLFDDGTTRLLLPEQMGMAAGWGYYVRMMAQDEKGARYDEHLDGCLREFYIVAKQETEEAQP